jgi:hypothetical protein
MLHLIVENNRGSVSYQKAEGNNFETGSSAQRLKDSKNNYVKMRADPKKEEA